MTTRWGDIRMGGRDAKPEYSTFTWIAMNICNALAAGLLIFGTGDWMFYVNTPPFGLEPGSVEAYEYASACGMFHWGFSALPRRLLRFLPREKALLRFCA